MIIVAACLQDNTGVAWCPLPPFPPYTSVHEFVRSADVVLFSADYPIPYGHAFDRSRFLEAGFGAEQ